MCQHAVVGKVIIIKSEKLLLCPLGDVSLLWVIIVVVHQRNEECLGCYFHGNI